MRASFRHSLVALVVLVAGCGGGGGGGGGDNDAPAGPYDVAKAWQNALTTAYSYTATGKVSGTSVSVTVTNTPFGAATYLHTIEGSNPAQINIPATRVDQTTTASGGGFSESAIARVYYTGTANVVGVEYPYAGGYVGCADVTTTLPLPTSATLGQSGPLYSAIEYGMCSGGGVNGVTSTATWSLNDYSGVPYFCINETELNPDGTDISNECIEVRTDGSLGSRVRLTFKFQGEQEDVLTGG